MISPFITPTILERALAIRPAACLALAGTLVACGRTSGEELQDVAIPNVVVTVTVGGHGSVQGAGIDCPSNCGTTLPKGTSFHLDAAPDAGARFSGWSGPCNGSGSCDFVANADVTVNATFADIPPPDRATLSVNLSGSGRVTSTPAAIGCPGTCSAAFAVGTAVQLAATADSGFSFSGWGGACTGSGPCAFTIGRDETVQAMFTKVAAPHRTLSVSVIASGTVTSTPAGISCPGTCSASFADGTSVALTVTAESGFSFSGWSGACSGSGSCSFTIGKDETVQATFTKVAPTRRTLSVSVTGSGTVTSAPPGISCPGACSASFLDNDLVALSAAADSSFAFTGWSGACSGSGSCAFHIGRDETVEATFTKVVPPRHTLSVSVSGGGKVTSAPAGISCPDTCSAAFDEGTSVTLTATASSGSTFSKWSGVCVDDHATCEVELTADRSVDASFATKMDISVTISPAAASLVAGATQQFTASVSGSADSAVAWSVAEGASGGSIDSTGLYTAPQSSGTFHVVAASHADSSRSATASVTVTNANASPIANCMSITTTGTYAVSGDLSSDGGACLDVHDTTGVNIDCGGHTVVGAPALSMRNVDGFSVTNCNFTNNGNVRMADLSQISKGMFQHDTFGFTYVNVVDASDVHFDQNTFDASYQQSYSHRVMLSSNTLVSQTRGSAITPALIISNLGSDNQIVDNVMDGKWVGSGQTETDDGVVITDESGDDVSGNTISNVFDCGIETVGVIANATINDNNITRTGFCGIGGWYYNSLKASTISRNVARDVPLLFQFMRIWGLRPVGFDARHEKPADTAVFFSDNVFDGNRLVDPRSGGIWSSIVRIYEELEFNGSTSGAPGERVPGPSDFVLKNNAFRNNDFGHTLIAPEFGKPIVQGLIVDDGGNVCNNSGGGAYPLACR
jgi:Divergent InlB B-repeat domain